MQASATISPEIRRDLGSARRVYRNRFADGIRPDPELTVSQWAQKERIVPGEQSASPGPWSNAKVPFLPEVMDCLSPSHPSREVTFKKSAQVGGTECGINWLGAIADKFPGPTAIFLPTVDMAKQYNRTKLMPSIEATPRLRRLIAEQKSRDERGSSTLFKKFPGGFCLISGANSSSGLQMFSLRYVLKEELSEWPYDVEGRGDPDGLVDKRTTSFGPDAKIFNNSTPGLKGSCRISVKYEAGDQRQYFVPCPHCDFMQVLVWNHLKFNKEKPYQAEYCCKDCGAMIGHHHKRDMLARGKWIAQNPGPGKQPSFHINQLYSPFVSWDSTVEEFYKAEGNIAKMKVFTQQVLGEAYEVKGDAPDEEKLFARRENYRMRHVPPNAIWITGAADVQVNRIEWDVYAWDEHFNSWLIDTGVIAGDPNNEMPWRELEKVIVRKYPDPWGKIWGIDAFGIDSGYVTQQVYRFVRRHAHKEKVYALDGRSGEGLPALGAPSVKDIDADGRKVGQVKLWPVGTWPMKTEFYGALRNMIEGPGTDGKFINGTAHYPLSTELDYFKQLTAEHFAEDEKRNGYVTRSWKKRKGMSNERLDIAVYARALAHHAIDSCDEKQLQQLKALRHGTQRDETPTLFSWLGATAPEEPEQPAAETPQPEAPPAPLPEVVRAAPRENENSYLGDRVQRWLERY